MRLPDTARKVIGGEEPRSPPWMRRLDGGSLAKGTGHIYRGLMVEENVDAAEPDVMAIFDTGTDHGLVCRVCGSLVAAGQEYPRAHWDWHEAANGA